MAELVKVNKKVIFDPLYTPVRKFLEARIAKLEVEGPAEELALAKERYTGLMTGDIVIEDAIDFPDGKTRVCIVSRKTGFARVDLEIERVTVKEIIADFNVPFVVISDIENLKTFSKGNQEEAVLLWLEYKNSYGVLLTQESAKTIEGPMAAFGELFFNQYTTERESVEFINYDTIESGTVTIKDAAFGQMTCPLFIQELVVAEANLPIITSNLPEFISTQRGQTFTIPNTYWFGGTVDITSTALVELTTGAGYTIPKRSGDLLSISGETIYGDSTKEVEDTIIVRVTHMYQNRPVRRTFHIKVQIEKDTAFDLTFKVSPEKLLAARGDDVEISVNAFFKGNPVTIAVPADKFVSAKGYGDLSYVETRTDGSMVYQGKITGIPPLGAETDSELYIAEFSHSDGGTVYKAPVYVNMDLIRAEDRPKFEIRGLTTTLRGYIDDTGVMEVSAFFDNKPVSAKLLNIKTGPRGDASSSIRFDEVMDGGIKFTVIRDSQQPGQDLEDSFEQTFRYIDDSGVKHNITRPINIVVSKLSVIEIVPVPPNPRSVTRYQKGTPTWKFLINGVDKTHEAIDIAMTNGGEYMVMEGPRWYVAKVQDEDFTQTVKFSWTQVYDGKNHQHEYEQEFLIKKWDPTVNPGGPDEGGEGGGGGTDGGGPGDNTDEGVNTNVVVFPMYYGLGGLSQERGKIQFRVYDGPNDITSTAVHVPTRMVVPPELVSEGFMYNKALGLLEWSYYKKDPIVDGKAKFFFKNPKDAGDPGNKRLGRMLITANVKQSRILKVLEITPKDIILDGTAEPVVRLSFAGDEISLLDPLLTITRVNKPAPVPNSALLQETKASSMVFKDTTLRAPGTSTNTSAYFEAKLIDPVTQEEKKLEFTVPLTTKIPALVRTYVPEGDIDTRIWDGNAFPVKFTIGERDITSLMVNSSQSGERNPYISNNGFSWSCYNAEREAVKTTLNVTFSYYISPEYPTNVTAASFNYNIEPWDGVTFGAEYEPKDIKGDAGVTGEIVAKFTYKRGDVTKAIRFKRDSSVIPSNIVIQDPIYVEGKGTVIRYTLQRGYKFPMKLVFQHPTLNDTINLDHTVDVTWAAGLNLETVGEKINGFHTDKVDLPLVFNFSGTKLDTNSPDLAITYISTPADATSLVETGKGSVKISLDKGGVKGNSYDYQAKLSVVYTDPVTSTAYPFNIDLPVTIRVPDVKLGTNPRVTAKVYARGEYAVTLVDERGKNVPITIFTPNGTNNYVNFVSPKSWYITKGDRAQPIITDQALTVSYDIGGNSYTMDVEIPFTISQFDGIDFTATTKTKKLEGNAGVQGVIEFEFTYRGDKTDEVELDTALSIIPRNLAVGELNNSKLPFTFVGQGNDNVKFVFKRKGISGNPVLGVSMAEVVLPVVSKSTNEPFVLVKSDDNIKLQWGKTGTLNVTVKYGDYELPGNAPGLRYVVRPDGDKAVVVHGGDANGIVLFADLGSKPGESKNYGDVIDIYYDVGASEPKKVTVSFTSEISTPVPTLINNAAVNVNIWGKATFPQALLFDTVPQTQRVKINTTRQDEKYIEMLSDFGYEVVGAEPTTQTQQIPLKLTYRIKGVDEDLVHEFNAPITIAGHDYPRFSVEVSPKVLQTTIGGESVISCRPVYKDVNVGDQATFKQELCTFPKQASLVKHEVVNQLHQLTFTGLESGVGEIGLVFWSPEAEAVPNARDVWSGTVSAEIMGEPGIEIGDRDNLITGKHESEGTYKLQVLFGGIPADIERDVTAGVMTFEALTPADAEPYAGVLSVTAKGKDSFDYRLTGPVQPGATVDVADRIRITYKWGGQTYTSTVEIPLRYTTSDVVVDGTKLYDKLNMWAKGNIGPITVTCDGKDLSSTWSITSQEGVKSKYVNLALKQYEIINADVAARIETVDATFSGTYRNRPWKGHMDLTFNINPWNQKTYEAFFSNVGEETWNGNTGDKHPIYIGTRYKGVVTTPGDLLDDANTDFKGLISTTYKGVNNVGGRWAWYEAEALKEGAGSIRMKLVRQDGDAISNPPVEDVDFTWLDFNVKVMNTPLTISGIIPLRGGNGDVVGSGANTVKLKTLNIPINDPNLVITLENEDIIKIKDRTNASMNYEVTAPMDKPKVQYSVKMTFTYTDPGTHLVHVGEAVQLFTIQDPADYPVVTRKAGFNPNIALWQKGNAPCTVTVKGLDVLVQVSDLRVVTEGAPVNVPEYWTPSGIWWQCTSGQLTSWPVSSTFYFKGPFRGNTVELSHKVDWVVGVTPQPVRHIWGTATPSPVTVEKDKPGEMRFAIVYRNDPYTKVVLNETLTDLKEALRIDSVAVDGNVILVKYTGLKDLDTGVTLPFVWDMIGQTDYVEGTNRVTVNVTAVPGIRIEPVPLSVKIWTRVLVPFKVMAGDTDITNQCGMRTVNSPRLKLEAITGTPPWRFQVIDCPKVEETVPVVYGITLPANYASANMDVTADLTFQAWDGREYEAKLPALPIDAETQLPVWSVPLGSRATFLMSAVLTNAAFPNGSAASAGSLVDQGAIAASGLFKWYTGGNNTNGFSATADGVTVGKAPGKMIATYYQANGVQLPNGYPHQTELKNKHTFDILYEVFEPKLTWKDGKVPERASMGYLGTGLVVGDLMFGREQVPLNACVITIKQSDQAKAYTWGTTANWAAGSFYLEGRYDNLHADYDTDVEITISWVKSGKTYDITYLQPVKLLGANTKPEPVWTAGDVKPVTGNVWDKGVVVPFSVYKDTVLVPWSDTVMSSVGVTDNQYVTAGPTTATGYRIIAGNTEEVQTDVEYVINLTDGVRVWVLKQMVHFTINPYDGVELKFELDRRSPFNNGIAHDLRTDTSYTFRGTFRGEPIPGRAYTIGNIEHNTTLTMYSVTTQNPGIVVANCRATADIPNTVNSRWLLNKVGVVPGQGGAKEGVDYVYMDIPLTIFIYNKLYAVEVSEEMTGKFGDKVEMVGKFRTGITPQPLGPTYRLSFTPNTVLSYNWANDIQAEKFYLGFAKEIAVPEVHTRVKIDVGLDGAPMNRWCSYFIEATQLSPVEKPVIQDVQEISTRIFEKGPLPFKVMHKGVDVSANITGLTIDGEYVGVINEVPNVWKIIKANPSEVTILPRFSFKLTVEGVTFDLVQEVKFTIGAFNGTKLTVTPNKDINVGLNATGVINFSGTWGTQAIGDTVTFDEATSDMKEILSIQGATPDGKGGININYTGIKLGKGDVEFVFRAKSQNAVPVEGYDWVKVVVPSEVLTAVLAKGDVFETVGHGTEFVPAVLNQTVKYDGVELSNTDPNLTITLSAGAKVSVAGVTAKTVTYRFLTQVTGDVIQRPTVIFEYKGVARIEVPLELTQNALASDLKITDVQDVTVEVKKSYQLPFKVIGTDGTDLTNATKLTSLTIDGDASYFRTDGSNTYSVIKAEPADKVGIAYYEISVLDNGVGKTLVVSTQMTIKAWATDIMELTMVNPTSLSIPGTVGKQSTFEVRVTRLGVPLASADVKVVLQNPSTAISIDKQEDLPDGVIKVTVNCLTVSNSRLQVRFDYVPDLAKPQVEGVTKVTKALLFVADNLNTLFVSYIGTQDATITGCVGDVQRMYPLILWNGEFLPANDPRLTWKFVDIPNQKPPMYGGDCAKITNLTEDYVQCTMTGRLLPMAGGPTTGTMCDVTIAPGVAGTLSSRTHKNVAVFGPKRSEVIGHVTNTGLTAGGVVTLIVEVPQPTYNWAQYGGPSVAPNWKLDGQTWVSGTITAFDKQTGTQIGAAIDIAGTKADGLGRYRFDVPTTHVEQELRISGILEATAEGLPRYEVLVPEFKVLVSGAKTTVIANPSMVDATLDVVTRIEFRTTQPRGGSVYTFTQAPNWTDVKGVKIDNIGSTVDNKPGYFWVDVKGLGIDDPTAHLQGLVKDEDGRSYNAKLNLKAGVPSYLAFDLIDKEVLGKENDHVTVNAKATYKGVALPLNDQGVVIDFTPSDVLEFVSATESAFVAKVIKDASADAGYQVTVNLTAHSETKSSDLTVNVEDVPELVVTDITTIIGGNNDVGNGTFKVSYRGVNIPLNDPKLTITPKGGFEITALRAAGFGYKITEPMEDVGKTSSHDVELIYVVNDNVQSKGKYLQPIQVTLPADYPRSNTPNGTATLWSKGLPSKFNWIVNSAGTNVTAQCEMVSWEPGWAVVPDAPNTEGNWYYIVSGPVANGSMIQKCKLRAPFRGSTVIIDSQVNWTANGVGADFSQLSGTVSPTVLEVENGKQKQAVFTMKYRNTLTTNVTLNQAQSNFIKDGKPVITIDKVEVVGDTVVVTYTGAEGAAKTNLAFCWDVKDVANPVMGETRGNVKVDTFTGMLITKNQNEKASIWQVKQIPFTVAIDGVDITSKLTMTEVVEPWISTYSPSGTGPRYRVVNSATVETTKDVTFRVKLPAANGGETIDVIVPITFAAWDGNIFTTTQYGSGNSNAVVGKAISASFGMTFKGSSVYYSTDWEVDRATIPELNDGFLAYDSEGVSTPSNWPWAAVHGTKPGYVEHGRIGIHYKGAGSAEWPRGTLGKNYSILTIGAVQVYDLGIHWKSGTQPDPLEGVKGTTLTIPADLIYRGTNALPANNLTSITILTPGIISAPTSKAATSWNTNVILDSVAEDVNKTVSIRYTYTNAGETFTLTYDQVITIKGTGVVPVTLAKADNFQTEGRGNKNNPVILTQAVKLAN